MNIDKIKYFVEISKEGSITAAAKKNNISQTALTQQMNELEKELGVKLLNRTKVGTTLTDKGKIFIEKAKRLLVDYNELIMSVKPRNDDKITIAYTGPLEQKILLKAIPKYQSKYPHHSIELKQYSMVEMKNALIENKCDIALSIPNEIVDDNFYHVIVAKRNIMVAISYKNKEIKNNLLSLKELNKYNVVLLKETSSINASEAVKLWCIKNGWTKQQILYADTIENQLLMVILNQGITFLPESDYSNDICLVPLKEHLDMHKTEAVFVYNTPHINEMIECLKKANS